MSQFLNPYHFVPVSALPTPGDLPRDRARWPRFFGHSHWERQAQVGKDNYEILSGRILCRMTVETPLVIGSEQDPPEPGKYRIVKPFEIDGRPAVPASSLRGCISSVAEAASNSALRVLDDQAYSYRKEMEHSLSALGLVVREDDQLRIRPLAMPTLFSEDC